MRDDDVDDDDDDDDDDVWARLRCGFGRVKRSYLAIQTMENGRVGSFGLPRGDRATRRKRYSEINREARFLRQ